MRINLWCACLTEKQNEGGKKRNWKLNYCTHVDRRNTSTYPSMIRYRTALLESELASSLEGSEEQ